MAPVVACLTAPWLRLWNRLPVQSHGLPCGRLLCSWHHDATTADGSAIVTQALERTITRTPSMWPRTCCL